MPKFIQTIIDFFKNLFSTISGILFKKSSPAPQVTPVSTPSTPPTAVQVVEAAKTPVAVDTPNRTVTQQEGNMLAALEGSGQDNSAILDQRASAPSVSAGQWSGNPFEGDVSGSFPTAGVKTLPTYSITSPFHGQAQLEANNAGVVSMTVNGKAVGKGEIIDIPAGSVVVVLTATRSTDGVVIHFRKI